MKKIVLFVMIAAACNGSFVSAKTWRVSNIDSTADFATLDAAMQGITAGDTIYLEGSNVNYTLSSAIVKKVAIVGPGYFLADNPNTQVNKLEATIAGTVSIMANETLFEGVAFTGSGSTTPLNIGADDVIIRKCYIGKSVYFTDNNANTQMQIKNTAIMQCYIDGNLYSYASNSTSDTAYNSLIVNNIFPNYPTIQYFVNAVMENNTFRTSIGYIYNNTGCYFRNNLQTPGTIPASNTNCTISNNYITGTADFVTSVTSDDGKCQLAATSGGMTAGINDTQCGAFGGSSPYILSGIANVPHIYDIEAPTAASAAGGLRVTVKVGTEQ